MTRGTILLVDDDEALCKTIALGLTSEGFTVRWRTCADEVLQLLATGDFDCLIADLKLPGTGGVELCCQVLGSEFAVPTIVITAFASIEAAVSAIRAGAYDFIAKPFEIATLALIIDRAVRHRNLTHEVRELRAQVHASGQLDEILGRSPPIRTVFELLNRVAPSEASVLITGESGTGKELVARAVHSRSARKDGPFVAVNCAAMPEALLESELFGHSKGAFTDAKSARAGLFVAAGGGTLFLDEIGEMPLAMQVKLLRALQERAVRSVGSSAEVAFDTRLITATNRDLDFDVSEGRFREDLFYRINVVTICLPPLRARGSDVLLLAQHFLRQFAGASKRHVTGLSHDAVQALLNYSWPGNVRELKNSMERGVALTLGPELTLADLPPKIRDFRSSAVLVESDDPRQMLPMHEVERRYILRVVQVVGGNKTQAAAILGVDRKTLYRKLESYEVSTMDSAIYARAPKPAAIPRPSTPLPTGARTAIVAEDDPEMRAVLSQVLRRQGFEVTEVADGLELIAAVKGTSEGGASRIRPDLIVSDIQMPRLSGLAALPAIRRLGMNVPVILITAFGDQHVHDEARRLGAAATLDKPVDMTVLRSLAASLAP